MAKITIILSDENDLEMKEMIKALSMEKAEGNPYIDRSESWIAKQIIKATLVREYEKYVKGQK